MPLAPSLPAPRRWFVRLRTLRAPLAATAAALALAAGCSDLTSPEGAGVYVLVAYEGQSLPAVVDEEPGVLRSELLSGELELRDDRTFAGDLRTRDTNLRTGAAVRYTESVSGRYTVRGRVVTFTTSNPDFDGAQGTLGGSTLELGPLTFRR